MSFRPDTIVYLLTGTGMDMNNSIWWHKYAYPVGNAVEQASWWDAQYYWFKSHSIAGGHFYYTYTDKMRGYVDVGKEYLNDQSIPTYEDGLGNSQKQAQIMSTNIPMADAIAAVDYIMFRNTIEANYAFVTGIESLNFSTARVYFEIDAIQTSQKFFHFGKCNVLKDHQFGEVEATTGLPIYDKINRYPEPHEPDELFYTYQFLDDNNPSAVWRRIGAYDQMVVLSDVDLQPSSITPNQYYTGLPAFVPSRSTLLDFNLSGGTVSGNQLGVGMYLVSDRQNDSFKLLGSYNAMEHILLTYAVPKKFLSNPTQNQDPEFITAESLAVIKFEQQYPQETRIISMPTAMNDIRELSATSTDGWKPLNYKSYCAPYNYYEVFDKNGGFMDILPQNIRPRGIETSLNIHTFEIKGEFTIAPSRPCFIYVDNYDDVRGGIYDPLMSLWQIPSYAMTPNNSGYNNDLVNAMYNKQLAKTLIYVGGATSQIGGLISFIQNSAVKIGSTALAAKTGSPSAGRVANQVGSQLPDNGQSVQNVGSQILSSGVKAGIEAYSSYEKSKVNQAYGLPAVVGGLPQGGTPFNFRNAGYEVARIHFKTHIHQMVDADFTVYGYNQNLEFRYPHINTRPHWTYVETPHARIECQNANEYEVGGVPHEYREQILKRMANGVTFWNVRSDMMDGDDSGAAGISSSDDARVQKTNFLKSVGMYGNLITGTRAVENSPTTTYARDYTDDYDYPY